MRSDDKPQGGSSTTGAHAADERIGQGAGPATPPDATATPPAPPSSWNVPPGPFGQWPVPPPPPQAWQFGPYAGGFGGGPLPMGMTAPRRPSRLPLLMSVVAACLVAFSGGLLTGAVGLGAACPAACPTSSPVGQHPAASATPQASVEDSALYQEALRTIEEHWVGKSSLSDKELLYGAIRGMVESLGDTSHSFFLTAEEYAAWQAALTGQMAGVIGVMLVDKEGSITVTRVFPGSPAAKAGVQPGDAIVKVDGTSTAGMSLGQVSGLIRGNAGTAVTLALIRRGWTTSFDLTVTRADYTIPLAEWGWVPGTRIADISLNEFGDGAADQLQAAISAARAAGATSIIFDLRGNPGGFASEAQEVASEFLASGTVYVVEDAAGRRSSIPVNTSRAHTDLRVVVLVNRDSASASEIVAGAIQDAGRGKIVGMNTFGTGTVTQAFPLSDGSVIVLGTSWWLTRNGRSVYHVGITPDEVVRNSSDVYPLDAVMLSSMTSAELDASGDQQLLAAARDLGR